MDSEAERDGFVMKNKLEIVHVFHDGDEDGMHLLVVCTAYADIRRIDSCRSAQ